MAVMAAQNSAKIAELVPKLLAKQPKQSEFEFRNMPPQADCIWLAIDAPSVLHLIKLLFGGDQITSLINGALGG